ncbi:hypothetical protein ACJX0J_018422, partial [Zea mays]
MLLMRRKLELELDFILSLVSLDNYNIYVYQSLKTKNDHIRPPRQREGRMQERHVRDIIYKEIIYTLTNIIHIIILIDWVSCMIVRISKMNYILEPTEKILKKSWDYEKLQHMFPYQRDTYISILYDILYYGIIFINIIPVAQ